MIGVKILPKITKTKVTPGVIWVEVPDAGMSILCGCPEDAVKHLMQRGFIQTTEKDSITYETGPNAILLSDLPIQNGSFCNLSEFPVLQMLYRQGMLLPDHVFFQLANNLAWRGYLVEEFLRASTSTLFLLQDGLAELNTLTADIDIPGTLDQRADVPVTLTAE